VYRILLLILLPVFAFAETAPRARDLGIPFDGTPGKWNAITDVAGVTVGHETIIRDLGEGRAVRTGVTAILPRGAQTNNTPVFGGWFALNGNGEMTGTTWLEESGFLEGPVMITNTHSIGAVHEGVMASARQMPAVTGGRSPWWPRLGTDILMISMASTCARSTSRQRWSALPAVRSPRVTSAVAPA
jgi:D-aminopeptidase